MDLIIKTDAQGFTYHWPAVLYIVEMWDGDYRAVQGDKLVVGHWVAVTRYGDEGQAVKCVRNFQEKGCTMRLTVEPQEQA